MRKKQKFSRQNVGKPAKPEKLWKRVISISLNRAVLTLTPDPDRSPGKLVAKIMEVPLIFEPRTSRTPTP